MNNSNNKGMSVLGVLQIIFIVLKCFKVITWSWWLVLIPLWVEIGVIAIVLIICCWLNNH